MPAASVIMPMKNTEKYVALAIQSIREQTFPDWELIVIDDGSTDNSRTIVNAVLDPRIRILEGPRTGIAAAFNRGMSVARGKYIFWCDSDDLFPADRLAWQIAWLEKHPEFGAVCASFQTIDPTGALVSNLNCGTQAEEITAELLGGVSRTSLNTFASYSQTYQRLGGLRGYFVTAEDLDFMFRLAAVCRIWYEPVLSYRYRLHNTSTTHTQPNPQRLFYEETSRLFARQRKERGSDDLEDGRPPAPPAAPAEVKPMDSRDQIYGMLLSEASAVRARGERGAAARIALRACKIHPLQRDGWRLLAACLFGPRPRS